MREEPILFGADKHLLGVLTEPVTPSSLPCLILLNAGLVYRVGPARLYVEVARRAASQGFPAFRFDLSGIGDSRVRHPPSLPLESGLADIADALDHLGAVKGIRRFILVGLCSGAVLGHHAAAREERVVGAVLLDGFAFPTLRSRLLRLADRISEPRRLLRGGLRRVMRQLQGAGTAAPPVDDDGSLVTWPAHAVVASHLTHMRDRRVELLLIYSEEWSGFYRYEGQMRDAFSGIDHGRLLSERIIARAEHLYFGRAERDAMLATLLPWLEGRFGGQAGQAQQAQGPGWSGVSRSCSILRE